MDEPKPRGVGRTLLMLLLFLVVLGLTGVVLYLLSDRNHGRYHLTVSTGTLMIERGRMLPFGSRPFEPESEDLRKAYAPIPIPSGVTVGSLEAFDDRADVDRALFGLMANWARERLEAKEPEVFDAATAYVDRCQLLPGLSEDQRRELKALRAHLSFRRGQRLLESVAGTLRQALVELNAAKELGTARQNDVDGWIAEVQAQLQAHEEAMRAPRRRAGDLGQDLIVPPPAEAERPLGEGGEATGNQPPKWRL